MSGESESASGLEPWVPLKALPSFVPRAARWSRGFLQCRPERWFPGIAAEWLPLAQSLGIELRVARVAPTIQNSIAGRYRAYVGEINGEQVRLVLQEDSAQVIGSALLKTALPDGREVLVDYLVRRLLTSLASSWSGPDTAAFRYFGERPADESDFEGAVRLELLVNGRQAIVSITLGERLVSLMDGLWRRQIRSASSVGRGQYEVRAEIAQLAVAPAALTDYTDSGTSIDLEVPVSEVVTLRIGPKPWLMVRMGACDGRIAFETVPSPVVQREIAPGTTRVAIELAPFSVDESVVIELAQSGAILVTDAPLTDLVGMVINGEKVADAKLQSYEGRFAVTVI